jgi:hypothetical protein
MAVYVMSSVTRALSWTAGVIEGMMSSVVGTPPPPRSLPVLMKTGRLADLRGALVGRNRRRIARALGAPPTACIGFGTCVRGAAPVTYWQASTWYYPLDGNRRQAIAIQFDGNCAKRVEFIGVE